MQDSLSRAAVIIGKKALACELLLFNVLAKGLA